PAEVRSHASPLAFIPKGRIVQRAVKKLTEDVHEFQLTMELDGAIGQPFPLDKSHHMVPGRGDRPEKMAIGDTLRGSTRAQLRVAALDLGLGHIHQPIIQVLVDLTGAGLEFVWWDLA